MVFRKKIVFLIPFIILCVIFYSKTQHAVRVSTYIYSSLNTALQFRDIKNSMLERHVVAVTHGRLGNQLMIYASLYGIAKRTRRTPIFCSTKLKDLKKLFPHITTLLYNAHRKKCIRDFNVTTVVSEKHQSVYYDTSIIRRVNVSKQTHVLICCHFINMQYFVEYSEDIKLQLKIGDVYQAKAQSYLFSMLRNYSIETNKSFVISDKGIALLDDESPVLVAIHVRRGDIIHSVHVTAPGPEYFKKARTYFKGKYGKNVIFVVITNGVLWCKRYLSPEKEIIFTGDSGKKSAMDDFSIAVSCNHTIMSVGTYSWWVGFLTGGEVVYVENFAGRKWKKWYSPKENFPPNWKGINMTRTDRT